MSGQAHSQRLVAGAGRYLDDISLPGALHLAVLRSMLASARLTRVDLQAAMALSGVVAAVTGHDLAGVTIPPVRFHPGLKAVSPPPVLPSDRVRYVGQPVAAVVAETRALARDALDQIDVDYDPLPVVGSVEAAIGPDAPLVHEAAPGNIGGAWRYTTGEVDHAFAQAEVTVALHVRLSRGHGNPLETRGCLARYDSATGELTVWVGHQLPHLLREALAGVCGLPRHRVRVVCPDIGGAFGLKNPHYPEYFLAALLAVRTGRPVKWVEERREHLLATTADREMIHDLELAATRDGVVLGVRDRLWVDLGCYPAIALTGMQYGAMHVPGPYRIKHLDIQAHGVFTHRSPTGSYRGFGRTNGTFVIERAVDRLANKLGLDPLEVRRRNLIRPDEMPWSVGITPPGFPPMTYDSGDYPRLLTVAAERLDYRAERARQAQARQEGRYVGIGLGCFVEASVGGGEGVLLRLEPSGRAVLVCGAPDIGQGGRATWAGLAARELGLRPDEVDVVAGDTGAIPYGTGTFASRTAAVAANATALAAKALADKIKGAASRIMECAAEDVELVDGLARLRGVPDRQVSLPEIAARVGRGAVPLPAPGLEVAEYFTAKGQTWASGVHAVVLEVDPERAGVQVRRYVAVGDCGIVLEPAIVEGQTIGGIAQGVGGSLLERLVYDDQAQLLSSTLMDYALPSAQQLPSVEVVEAGSPSPLNPLGTKGAGESGCMGAPAAIAAALEDALQPLGIHVDELPMTHDQLFQVLAAAGRS